MNPFMHAGKCPIKDKLLGPIMLMKLTLSSRDLSRFLEKVKDGANDSARKIDAEEYLERLINNVCIMNLFVLTDISSTSCCSTAYLFYYAPLS